MIAPWPVSPQKSLKGNLMSPTWLWQVGRHDWNNRLKLTASTRSWRLRPFPPRLVTNKHVPASKSNYLPARDTDYSLNPGQKGRGWKGSLDKEVLSTRWVNRLRGTQNMQTLQPASLRRIGTDAAAQSLWTPFWIRLKRSAAPHTFKRRQWVRAVDQRKSCLQTYVHSSGFRKIETS